MAFRSRFHLRRGRGTTLGLFGLAALGAMTIGAVTFASSHSSDEVISACYKAIPAKEKDDHDEGKGNGALRIVNSASDCSKKETFIQWNQTGPQGEQGPAGADGEPGPSVGALLWADQWHIGQPPASYGGLGSYYDNINNRRLYDLSGDPDNPRARVSVAVDATLIIHASGTAWCLVDTGDEWATVWLESAAGRVAVGTLSRREPCGEGNHVLTSVAAVGNVPAGEFTITFEPANGLAYDSVDRWNVTVLAYSR